MMMMMMGRGWGNAAEQGMGRGLILPRMASEHPLAPREGRAVTEGHGAGSEVAVLPRRGFPDAVCLALGH